MMPGQRNAYFMDEPPPTVAVVVNMATLETAWMVGEPDHEPLEPCRNCGYALAIHSLAGSPWALCPDSEFEAAGRWGLAWTEA